MAEQYYYKLKAQQELLEAELKANEHLEIEYNLLKKNKDKLTAQIEKLNEHKKYLLNAKAEFGNKSTEVNKEVVQDLETIINRALKTAFPYLSLKLQMQFKSSTSGKRRTAIEISLLENEKVRDLNYLTSKGVQQVIALLEQVTHIVIANKSRLIFIDEGLTGISDENVDTVIHLLTILHEELGFQFILNEHNSALWEKSKDLVRVLKLANENNQVRVQSSYEV